MYLKRFMRCNYLRQQKAAQHLEDAAPLSVLEEYVESDLGFHCRVEGVTNAIADNVQAEHRDENEQTRQNDEVRPFGKECLCVCEHIAPRWRWWLHAKS